MKVLTALVLAIGLPASVLSQEEGTSSRPEIEIPTAPTQPILVEFELQLRDSEVGSFVVEVHPEWAPLGAERFLELVDLTAENAPTEDAYPFFDGLRVFRVLEGFIAQFGIPGNPTTAAYWREQSIPDDPVLEGVSNDRGTLSFAMRGEDTRTTQLFFNLGDNPGLDDAGFVPFAKVIDGGMAVVDRLFAEYGEGAPRGTGPDQGLIQEQGNAYLEAEFPELSYVTAVRRIEPLEELDEAIIDGPFLGDSSAKSTSAIASIMLMFAAGLAAVA